MGFGKDGMGIIQYDFIDLGLGALASLDVINGNGRVAGNLVEDFRIIKMDYWIAFRPA